MRAHVAYDYEAQRWVKGEPARRLLIAQAEETLAILTGPGAADYLRFTRTPGFITVEKARAAIQAQLVELAR